ncbi:DUF6973 domain-containing protein [Photorhabdus bodei]|uniref:DUF6973 domain-containing protein n=3 Tax=Photorhabdus TaxID=29487 RepID=A0ABX0AMK2_9GAMM|nr:hypothetical protein [Photorhabdus bodei]NDK99615.1 hypothetical protein [Photorhabdus bodei]NDL03987.1 hypothetical protein [Photorhabdus bodei]NDL08105.1 hypothetical protein [Photorhabdus bodei]
MSNNDKPNVAVGGSMNTKIGPYDVHIEGVHPISYYEGSAPFDSNDQKIEIQDKLQLDSETSFLPNFSATGGYMSSGQMVKALTDGAKYAPMGGIGFADIVNTYKDKYNKENCPICEKKDCPVLKRDCENILRGIKKFGSEKKAFLMGNPNITRPIMANRYVFNSTLPVVMSYVSKFEGRVNSNVNTLREFFDDRFFLEQKINSFRLLPVKIQAVLQVFVYGRDARDSKYDKFYNNLKGSIGEVNYNKAIKELHDNMPLTERNLFVLNELIKANGNINNEVGKIKKLTTYLADFDKKYGYGTGEDASYSEDWYGAYTGESNNLPQKMKEILFAMRHPIAAYDIGLYERGATNITTNAVRFSTQGNSKTNPNGTLLDNKYKEGSQVNAFRHTLWQATIAARYGEEVALHAGNAHESNPKIDLNIRQFAALKDADQTIDLLNNQIGRRIGLQSGNSSMKAQAKAVLNRFHKEGLYVAKKNAMGFEIVKEKITDEQFSYMNSVFERGNEDGFSPE